MCEGCYAAAFTTRGATTFFVGPFTGLAVPLPLAPVLLAPAILAARSAALLLVRGTMEGGACATLARGFGLVGDVVASLAEVSLTALLPLGRLAASTLFGRGAPLAAGADSIIVARERSDLWAAAEAGRVGTELLDVRDEEREYEVGLLAVRATEESAAGPLETAAILHLPLKDEGGTASL